LPQLFTRLFPPERRKVRIAGLVLLGILFAANLLLLCWILGGDGAIQRTKDIVAIGVVDALLAALGWLMLFHPRVVAREAPTEVPDRENVESILALRRDEPVARWEWMIVALVCAACLLFWAAHFHFFYVPNSDYYSFERNAERIWSLQVPSSFKRMPAFSFFMWPVAQLLPGEDAALDAALLLNLGFSAGSLLLFYLIARRWVGWLAIAPTVALATAIQFHVWALQPIAEPCIGFFALLTFFLFQRRSRWQYAAALVASLTRYELIALIPIVLVLNLIYDRPAEPSSRWEARKKRLGHVLLAALASSGAVFWAALILLGPGGRVPYTDYARSGPFKYANPWYLLTTLVTPFNVTYSGARAGENWRELIAVALAVLLGMCVSLGMPQPRSLRRLRFRRESAFMLAFLTVYVLIHISFSVNRRRYTYPTTWILLLYATVGVLAVARCLSFLGRYWTRKAGYIASVLLVPFGAFYTQRIARSMLKEGLVLPGRVYLAFGAAILALLAAYLVVRFRRRAWVMLPLATAFVVVQGRVGVKGINLLAESLVSYKYRKYEYLPAGRWLAKNLKKDEKAVMLIAWLARHTGRLGEGQLLNLRELDVQNHPDAAVIAEELAKEMRRRSIRYLIFTPRGHLYQRELPTNPDSKYIELKMYLLLPFKDGKAPPGFRQVAKLVAPGEPQSWQPPGQRVRMSYVYEVVKQPI